MRILPLLLALVIASNSWALIDPQCQEKAHDYLRKGDITSPFGGDRLWALERLNRDFVHEPTDNCLRQVHASALADAKEYWVGYISSKYGCGAEDSLALPAERPAACPVEKWKLVKLNVRYIERIEKRTPAAINQAQKTVCPPQKKNPQQNLMELGNYLSDPCSKIASNPNRKIQSQPSSADLSKFSSCLTGLKSGVGSLGEKLSAAYTKLSNFITDPGYRAAVRSSLSDLYTALATSPKETLKALYESLVTEFVQYKSEFQCLSPDGMVQEICNQVAEKGLPAILGMGAVRAALLAVKAGKKITTGVAVLKEANKSVALADEGIAKELKAVKQLKDSGSREPSQLGNSIERSKAPPRSSASEAEPTPPTKTQQPQSEAPRNKFDPKRDAEQIQKFTTTPDPRNLNDVKKALDLPSDASAVQVKKEIQRLRKKYHPDLNPDYGSTATAVQKRLNLMNDILVNKNQKY